ncbi:uncharacterized protein LOC130913658 [Corythoichthys intestinalis]|uniref:uncharacterized protein LOC130913658 n=1 Tax=Corythoichthys intestinalis TaxID=161448 RepID=UPI0025A4E608|nr:uncharacterized protein LOC130913658 [Corythoichthys intestinalis]
MLKELVRERLVAAAEEIFGLFERTMASYEEQLCRAREESERHRRQLQAVCKCQVVLQLQDIQELIGGQEEVPPQLQLGGFSSEHSHPPSVLNKVVAPELPNVKVENIKSEEDGAYVSKLSLRCDSVEGYDNKDERPSGTQPGEPPQEKLSAPPSDSNDSEEPAESGADGEVAKMEPGNSVWSDDEVKALLAIYSTESAQRGLDGSQRNIKIFAKISSHLEKAGIYHSGKQCREKIKKLKQDYKRIKNHNNQSGAKRKTGKWYETLDVILGHRPAYSGNATTKDPSAELLRSLIQKENNPPSLLLEEQNRSLLANPIPVACSTQCRLPETPMALSSNSMPPLSDNRQPASENPVAISYNSLPPQSASTSRLTSENPVVMSCHSLPPQSASTSQLTSATTHQLPVRPDIQIISQHRPAASTLCHPRPAKRRKTDTLLACVQELSASDTDHQWHKDAQFDRMMQLFEDQTQQVGKDFAESTRQQTILMEGLLDIMNRIANRHEKP